MLAKLIVDQFLEDVKKNFTLDGIKKAEEKALLVLDTVAKLSKNASALAIEVAPLTGPYAGQVLGIASVVNAASKVVDNVIPDQPVST